MKYELALELKNAGFPQKDNAWYYTDENTVMYCGIEHSLPEMVMKPTLSELIENCGEGIARLWRVDESYDKGKTKWCATGKNDFLDGLGTTPEEAVANLWLALNKQI